MAPETHCVSLNGGFLRRGFWLYVWQIKTIDDQTLHYVGRTGDSSSPNAQSPFVRMGQHLGAAKNSSMLRNHLAERKIDPTTSRFRLIAHGPVLPEGDVKDLEVHRSPRDQVAAVEKQLALDLVEAKYDVLNKVRSRKVLNLDFYAPIRAAFAAEFPRLG